MTNGALVRPDRGEGEPFPDALRRRPSEAVTPDPLPCRNADPELWFAESRAKVDAAKALCRQCPVQELCLAGALERREPWGVWGGQVFAHGVVVAIKRGRGRPRKDEVAPAGGPALVPQAVAAPSVCRSR